jgi:O-methyltransferase domain
VLDQVRPWKRNEELPGAVLTPGFAPPTQDLGGLLAQLGSKLFTRDHTLVQYIAWSANAGLFEFMSAQSPVTVAQVSEGTALTANGADALLGVLCALGLAMRDQAGRYSLMAGAREYFLRSSPFFIADQFIARGGPIHRAYVNGKNGLLLRLRLKALSRLPALRFGSRIRLRNQHARNLAACATAVRTGEFAAVRCLVDIAGGSGTFSIPFALENPGARVVLAELPQALPNIRHFLREHSLDSRVELLGINVLEYPWKIPRSDGTFIGNFLHGFSDETCVRICREAFDCLSPGGKIWIHEMVWNPNKDGPLITALLNAGMRSGGAGRQRTALEIRAILERAGFAATYAVPSAGAFALVAGQKPH